MTNSLKEPANLEIDALAKEVVMQGGNKDDRIDTLCNVMAQHFETVVGVPHGTAKEKATMIVLGISRNTSRQFVESEMQGAIQHWKAVDALRSQIKIHVFGLSNVLANTNHFNRIRDNMSIDMSNAHVTQVGNDASIITVGDSTPDTSFIVHRTTWENSGSITESDKEGEISTAHKNKTDGYFINSLNDFMPSQTKTINAQEYGAARETHPVLDLFSTVGKITRTMITWREKIGLANSGPVVRQTVARAGLEMIGHVLDIASIPPPKNYPNEPNTSWPISLITGRQVEQACRTIINSNGLSPREDMLPPLDQAAQTCMATNLSMAMGEAGRIVRENPNAVVNSLTTWLTEKPDRTSFHIPSPYNNDVITLSRILKYMDPNMMEPIQTYARETDLNLPPVEQRCRIIYAIDKINDPNHIKYIKPLELVVDDGDIRHVVYEEQGFY